MQTDLTRLSCLAAVVLLAAIAPHPGAAKNMADLLTNKSIIINPKSIEKKLIHDIMVRYKKLGINGRPVQDSSKQIEVKFGLALVQILGLDENKQILRTNCWSRHRWHDALLKWDPKKYHNISVVRVYPDQVWTPDIQLFNFADERIKVYREARLVLDSNGDIMWIPQALFKSTCAVEISFFPFDTQICRMDFGSRTYDLQQMYIDFYEYKEGDPVWPYIDFTDYILSNEWKTDGQDERKKIPALIPKKKQIPSIWWTRNQNFSDSTGQIVTKTYPVLRYRLRIRRNPDFYTFILIIPCVLLSSLTLIVFWLPPESPAKMILGMNIFVAFFVLLLLLAESTPSAVKKFPIIGAFFCLNMIMITLSTFLATIVINFYVRGDKRGPLPPWIRRIMIDGMGRILMIRQHIPLATTRKLIQPFLNKRNMVGSPKSRLFFSSSSSKSNAASTAPILMMPTSSSIRKSNQSKSANDHVANNNNNNTDNYNNSSLPTISGQKIISVNNEPEIINSQLAGKPEADQTNDSDHGRIWHERVPQKTGTAKSTSINQTCGSASNDVSKSAMNSTNQQEVYSSMSTATRIENDVREIRRYIRMFIGKQKENEQRNMVTMEWRTLALILDRLFFMLYVSAIAIAMIVAFPTKKQLEAMQDENDIPKTRRIETLLKETTKF